MTSRRATWIVLSLAVMVLALFMYKASGVVSLSSCGEEIIRRVPSPNGSKVAVLFERNCGATVGYVRHVNVSPSEKAFRVDASGAINDGLAALMEGQADVSLVWADETALVLTSTAPWRSGAAFVSGVSITRR